MTEEKKDNKFDRIPTAKRHKLLDTISDGLRGAHVTRVFKVLGFKYRMKTLDPHEESWADGYVEGQNFYQTARSRRAPYVAASITHIGEMDTADKELTPRAKLFDVPDDMPDLQRDLIEGNEEFHEAWLREEMLKWLIEKDKHGPFVQELYRCYIEIEDDRAKALENLDPLSKKTPTGGSSDTSSQEKESSSATQVSPA